MNDPIIGRNSRSVTWEGTGSAKPAFRLSRTIRSGEPCPRTRMPVRSCGIRPGHTDGRMLPRWIVASPRIDSSRSNRTSRGLLRPLDAIHVGSDNAPERRRFVNMNGILVRANAERQTLPRYPRMIGVTIGTGADRPAGSDPGTEMPRNRIRLRCRKRSFEPTHGSEGHPMNVGLVREAGAEGNSAIQQGSCKQYRGTGRWPGNDHCVSAGLHRGYVSILDHSRVDSRIAVACRCARRSSIAFANLAGHHRVFQPVPNGIRTPGA